MVLIRTITYELELFFCMQKIDKPLLWCTLGLAIFGLVMMSSMSIASSYDITGKNDFYFWRHFRYLLLGIPCFLVGLKFPIEYLKKLSGPIYIVGVMLLLITLIWGENYGTFAKLWIRIGSLSLQPVEATKLAVIIGLAGLFANDKIKPSTIESGLIPFVVALALPAMFLVIQSDFGALFVVSLTAGVMFFTAGAKIRHFLGGIATAAVAGLIVVSTVPYIRRRMLVFLDPSLDTQNTGFQVQQALIAIGSGRIFGRGFQNSVQKFDYLPEVQSDTIFSAIAEEMGFFRIIILIGVYLLILFRGFMIAEKVRDPFMRYAAIGITTWITGQAFVNIGVNMALLPNTGITLPLISYGGSSMLLTFLALGVLLQISQYQQDKGSRYRWRR
jgi:cell division protein FtsW